MFCIKRSRLTYLATHRDYEATSPSMWTGHSTRGSSEGASKVRPIAEKTLSAVKSKVGLG